MPIPILNGDNPSISYHPSLFRSFWIDLFAWNMLFNEIVSHKLHQTVAPLSQPIGVNDRLYTKEALGEILWTSRSFHPLVPSFTVAGNNLPGVALCTDDRFVISCKSSVWCL